MEKILLISSTSSLQERLTDLLGSPRHIARISSWTEALRVLAATPPVAVVVGPEMADPSQVSQIIGLNNILQDHKRPCFVLVSPDDPGGGQWLEMFDSVAQVAPLPTKPGPWAEFIQPIQALLGTAKNDSAGSPSPPAKEATASKFVVRMLPVTVGQLTKLPLARVLYSLHIQKASGLLQLQTGSVKRAFAFRDGDLVVTQGTDSVDALLSAFAWPNGSFHFQPRPKPSGPNTSIFPILYQGLSIHRPQRLIMDALMPMMATFPAATELRRLRKGLIAWPTLERFLDACDGQKTLEALLSTMGQDITAAFRAALFASDTDLIIFHNTPAKGLISVEYEMEGQAGPVSAPQPTRPADKDSERIAHRDLEKKLRSFHKSMRTMSPYEIFGIWEGCGREVVKTTFYSLVKEHHPDVHGGNASEIIKDLAQKIFVEIRRAYTQLMALEDKQTVPPPSSKPLLSKQQSPGRRPVTTLHPGQVSAITTDPVQRAEHQSPPIGMSRTPTDLHPDLTSRLRTRTQSSPRPKAPAPTTPPPRRSISHAGLADSSSDVEWRREQMERLERKPSRPIRRPTPIAIPQGSIPPATSPAQDAFNTGYQLFKQHQFQDALPSLESAHKKEPENSLFMTFYAYCLFQIDPTQVKTSKELLHKAIESQHPQALPDAHLFLGTILKINDRPDQAFYHFQKALELNPASRDAEREVRLYQMRHGKHGGRGPGKKSFFRNLFKKDS